MTVPKDFSSIQGVRGGWHGSCPILTATLILPRSYNRRELPLAKHPPIYASNKKSNSHPIRCKILCWIKKNLRKVCTSIFLAMGFLRVQELLDVAQHFLALSVRRGDLFVIPAKAGTQWTSRRREPSTCRQADLSSGPRILGTGGTNPTRADQTPNNKATGTKPTD